VRRKQAGSREGEKIWAGISNEYRPQIRPANKERRDGGEKKAT